MTSLRENPEAASGSTGPGEAGARDALRLHRVSKTYGRHRALIDVSLEFLPGRVAAVLGPNGAGKTTTLVPPSSGQVTWGDAVLGRQDTHVPPLRGRIGYVGHEPGLYGDLTASENLALFCGLYGVPDAPARSRGLLERVGLGDVRQDAV